MTQIGADQKGKIRVIRVLFIFLLLLTMLCHQRNLRSIPLPVRARQYPDD